MGFSSASSLMALMWYGVRGHRVRGHRVTGSWGQGPGVTGLYRAVGSCTGPEGWGRGLGLGGVARVWGGRGCGRLWVWPSGFWAGPEGCGRGFGFGAVFEWWVWPVRGGRGLGTVGVASRLWAGLWILGRPWWMWAWLEQCGRGVRHGWAWPRCYGRGLRGVGGAFWIVGGALDLGGVLVDVGMAWDGSGSGKEHVGVASGLWAWLGRCGRGFWIAGTTWESWACPDGSGRVLCQKWAWPGPEVGVALGGIDVAVAFPADLLLLHGHL